jgi:hypothetical protein
MEPETTCNAILDFSVHANNMSKTSAAFIGCGSFQQQAEADGKWNRVTLSQVQLCSYFTDTEMILEKDEGRWQI